LNHSISNINLNNNLSFEEKALAIFKFQYQNCKVYHDYINALGKDISSVNCIEKIPFLPISFFKTHEVKCSQIEPQIIFKSSGTTGMVQSTHFVTDAAVYLQSMTNCFTDSFGKIEDYCFLALLPSYLEKNNSSLVYMVEQFMKISKHPKNGFYLYNHKELNETLLALESINQKTILIGVTYALLDFADQFKPYLKHTTVMETGGMKGRRKEWLKSEVHDYLNQAFNKNSIASEYGMTELLSQFYAPNDGKFKMQKSAKVWIRDLYDPFQISNKIGDSGCLNIVDLSNINSCSFIATDDIGKILTEDSFEINGRVDNSDVRGCNLMIN
jgi:phenylacetate-coenzyme A ligase PaaK-like adenylate-forming protein